MFFVLSKTARASAACRPICLIVVGLAGLALMATRFRRAGARLAVASLCLLLLIGMLPVGSVLLHIAGEPLSGVGRLARRARRHRRARRRHRSRRLVRPRRAGRAAKRPTASSPSPRLARQFPNARIVFSGGNGSLSPGEPAEADFVYPLLDDFGIRAQRVTLENRSRNTEENATFSKEIARAEARRALAAGDLGLAHAARGRLFPPRRFPGRGLSGRLADAKAPGLFACCHRIAGLTRTDDAVHEWLGLVAYWLTGRTSEFLPGP